MKICIKISKFIFAAIVVFSIQMPVNAGMPGLRGSQHIGITVPDVDKAVEFFVDVIGCESFFSIGPFGPFEDNWMTENLNVNPRAVIEIATLVRCENGPAFEIFKYTSPDQNLTPPKNSDIGGHHIAFYVDDINKATQYLRDNGVKILGEPHPIPNTPMEGLSWVYFLTPWGMQMEIVSYPYGQAYERENSSRMWDPRH